jgi:hypothetical protein
MPGTTYNSKFDRISLSDHAGTAFRGGHMGDRTTRFWVAVLLTGMDIAVFQHFFGVIWLTWSGVEWIRMVLLSTLALWAGSAAVLWLHIYYDLRHLLYERRSARTLNVASIPADLREDSDV